MGEKIYCKDLKREIDKNGCYKAKSRNCQTCLHYKLANTARGKSSKQTSIPNILSKKPSKDKMVAQERVCLEAQKSPAIYDKSIHQLLEAHRKHYEEKHNSLTLMLAFTEAVKYKQTVPEWIVKKLDEVFRQYLFGTFEKEKDRSIERLLDLKKGKGQSPATEEFERWGRDIQLVTTMDMLIRHGISAGMQL